MNIYSERIYPSIEDFILSIQKDDKYIIIDKNKLELSGDQIFWYRRGGIYFNIESQTKKLKQSIFTSDAMNELNSLKEVVYDLIDDGKCFASFRNAGLNRLYTLISADKFKERIDIVL